MKKKFAVIFLIFIFSFAGIFGWPNISVKSGVPSSTQPSCTVGSIYFQTNATAGQNLWLCTSTNTWTQLTGTGGGGGGIDVIAATQGTNTYTYTVPASMNAVMFTATLTENVTSSTLADPVEGMKITFRHTQDGTGGRTYTAPVNVIGLTSPELTPGAVTTQTGTVGADSIWRPDSPAIISGLGGTAGFSNCPVGTDPGTNPPSGVLRLFCASDGFFKTMNSSGTIKKVGTDATCGAGSSVVNSATATTLGSATYSSGISAGSQIKITTFWTHSSGTSLTPRMRILIGGTDLFGGDQVWAAAGDGYGIWKGEIYFPTTSSQRAQFLYYRNYDATPNASTGTVTSAIDTSGSVTLAIQGLYSASGNPGETLTLTQYCIERLP